MIEIEGDYQEGGGQIIRSSLALSALTGRPFHIRKVRANRPKPGLKAQHLAAVKLLTQLTEAQVEGARKHSTELTFKPGPLKPGTYRIDVKTAGSVTLLLQAALLPALNCEGAVTLELVGGTDVNWSPTVAYLSNVVLPHFPGRLSLSVSRHGFMPQGGGLLRLEVPARTEGKPLTLEEQQPLLGVEGLSVACSSLKSRQVAERQAQAARERLRQLKVPIQIDTHYTPATCPGTSLTLWSLHQDYRIGADGLGQKRRSAESVGETVAGRLLSRLQHPAPIEEHLTDQLVPLLSLYGGRLRSQEVSPHTLSNLYVCSKFGGRRIEVKGDRLIAL